MNRSINHTDNQAFSLVELSIVLVILGLLVGGILSGQSLIRASELRSVTSEYQTFVTSLGTFRDRYFALPGDLSNAVSFWGAANTDNGDGDGAIEGTTTAATNETGLAWQHMARATIIEGSYTPTSWAATVRGSSNPKAKLNLAAWHIRSVGTIANTSGLFFEGNYGNALVIMSGADLSTPSGGVLKSEEAWNIDTKIDDGKPQIGSVTALESLSSATPGAGCGNAAVNTGGATAVTDYDLSNTAATACALVFKTGY